MKRAFALALMSLVIAGIGASAASAGKPPDPKVVCGSCDGGGVVSGCATVGVSNTGGRSGGTVSAIYHWCWRNGAIYDNYGYAVHSDPCCAPVIQFDGYNPAYGFGNGYTATGVYSFRTYVPVAGWVAIDHESVRACVQVNGWGGYSGC